jgi:hypothetical protein
MAYRRKTRFAPAIDCQRAREVPTGSQAGPRRKRPVARPRPIRIPADTLTVRPVADKGIRDWIEEYVDEKTAHEIRIQYGGSATAENAPELSNYPDIVRHSASV